MLEDKRSFLIPTYPDRGISFERGERAYLIDGQGRRYLDLGSNYGINIFGYSHPRITDALVDQLGKLVNLHGSFSTDIRSLAARRLVEFCGRGLEKVYFANSGAEAVEAALKFARLATGKCHFVAMKNGYHGKTLGALSATGGEKYRQPFLPLLWEFSHVPFGDISGLSEILRPDTAALLVEPVQGEGGVRTAPAEYFAELQSLCRRKGILLIVDEIQTGAGRTGRFLAGELYGLRPDLLCLGKGIAGGIPIGVTIASREIAEAVPLHAHTSTFGGNPLAAAGILAVLDELSHPELLAEIRSLGEYFLQSLCELHYQEIVEARGIGLMLALELSQNTTPVLRALQQRRIIAIPAGSNIVRFLPPFIIKREEIDIACQALNEILRTVRSSKP